MHARSPSALYPFNPGEESYENKLFKRSLTVKGFTAAADIDKTPLPSKWMVHLPLFGRRDMLSHQRLANKPAWVFAAAAVYEITTCDSG
jgi:hypothetical protein